MGGFSREVSGQDFQEFFRNPELIHFIASLVPCRPGLRLCMTSLEYTHYPPSTPESKHFSMSILEWSGIVWAIMSIPASDRHLMDKFTKECGLRIVDGIPILLGSRGKDVFPIFGSNVFSLQNVPGHPIYSASPEEQEVMEQQETAQVEMFFHHWSRRN